MSAKTPLVGQLFAAKFAYTHVGPPWAYARNPTDKHGSLLTCSSHQNNNVAMQHPQLFTSYIIPPGRLVKEGYELILPALLAYINEPGNRINVTGMPLLICSLLARKIDVLTDKKRSVDNYCAEELTLPDV